MSTSPTVPSELPADPVALRDIALATAVTAADMVRERRRAGFGIDTKSTATDMVTDVDRASDRLIRELLADARPDDGVITEEDTEITGTTGVVWIADPIDGTTNFVYDHPPYTVSIAAVVDGMPIAGAVVEISADDRYHAALGAGSFRNGVRLGLDAPPPLERAMIATGFGYDPRRRSLQAAVVGSIIDQVRDIRRLGAASFDLCGVAVQRIDAYYEHGLGAWDLAAGQIIAAEAGAAVESILGGPPDPAAGIMAAHPALIGPLRELLVANGVAGIV
ncbi:MAG: inositol monophosphatase family protein [Acidimicrobiales bacterium]